MKKNKPFGELFYRSLKKTLLTMRIAVILMILGILQARANDAYAQKTRLSLNFSETPLVKVLDKIEDESEFFFLYNEKLLDTERKVSIDAKDQLVSVILDKLFTETDVQYTIIDRKIILAPGYLTEAPQQKQLSGTVTGKDGSPLPGVNVVVTGTTQGTITDIEGKYTIQIPQGSKSLTFSFIGMEPQEISIGTQTQIDVTMTELAIGLDEIVVTGYSTQRKKDIIGSVVVADVASLKNAVATSAQNALQGMASGVNVINSGIPGAAAKIFVRGVTSFGNTDPLVIIDGIAGSLNNISATEIESIQVLKDAGSSAIYGVRGANGVVIVTTKKGKTGPLVFSYEGSYGMTYPLTGNPYEMLSSEDWFNLFKTQYPGSELLKQGGVLPDYVYRGPSGAKSAMEGDPGIDPALYRQDLRNTGLNYIIQKVNKTNNGGDWWNWTFNKAPTKIHNISASGGTDKAKYLFNICYTDQKGTMVESYLKRYSARVNTEYQFNKNIRIGENLNIIHRSVSTVGDGTMSAAWRMSPIVPLYDIKGNWGGTWGGPDLGVNNNAVALAFRDSGDDKNFSWGIIGNAYAEADFLKDFTARTSIGYSISNTYFHNFTANQPENLEQSTIDNSLSISAGYGSTMTWTNTLNYKKTIDKHDVKIMVGSEAISSTSRTLAGSSSRFFTPTEDYQILGNGTLSITNSSSVGKTTLFSLFTRLDYAFDNKYLFGATIRRDGSSVFGPEKRYGIFPSVSLGWKVTNENFMQNVSWLDDLKIRGSYGVLGSQNNVSSTNAFSLYGSGLGTTYYDITGASTSTVLGFARSRIGNPFTGWEENIVSNFGFDATILNNKIEVSVEYYKKSIKGLLFTEPLPAVIIGGATAPTVNIGDIQNTGIDGSIKYRGKIISDLNYSVALNVTTYKNMVVDIPAPGYFDAGSMQAMGSICRNQEGYPVSSFFGYKVIGLFNSDQEVTDAPTQNGAAPGRFKYQDTDKDGAITPADRIHLGNPNPDFTYGLNLNLEYKGFDLTSIFYGSQGNEVFHGILNYNLFFGNYMEAKSNRLLNAWTPENTNTTVPKVEVVHSFSTDQVCNSYYVENGSYFRLRSLVLGYTVKPSILQRIGISKLRLYGQAGNLFTITKYTGIDPEIGGSASNFGLDVYGVYPNNETSLIFGLNVTF